jgi:hypothetical protein
MIPFEQVKIEIANGTKRLPSIMMNGKNINPVIYELTVHKFYLSLMAKGISNRQVKLSYIKKFYGLKGRTAAEVLPGFMRIYDSEVPQIIHVK